MDLMDFYEKQQNDIERFKAMRDKAWQEILCDNEKLAAAYGGKENLIGDARKLYDIRIETFNAKWSMDGGSLYNAMVDQHDKQFAKLTGTVHHGEAQEKGRLKPAKENPAATTKEKFTTQGNDMTDKDAQPLEADVEAERNELRAKAVRQQAAIKAKRMLKKRGR